MADKVIAAKLQVDSGAASNSVKGFKSQLKEANEELVQMTEKFGAASQEAVTAAKKVAGLRDALGDAKSLSDAFNPDAKFTAFSNALNGVIGGFTGLTGAMALFGGQSEDVEKILLKVQSAMALSQGINSVLEAKDSFIQLAAKIKDTTAFQKIYSVGTALAATATKAFGASVETTSTGFKVLRGAIIATGIGALVVLITTAISAIVDWVSGTDDAKAAQDRLKSAIDNVNESLRQQQSELRRAQNEALAKAKADGKSEEDIYKIKKDFGIKNQQLTEQAIRDKYEQLKQFEKYRHQDEESESAYQNALKDYNESYQQLYDQQSQARVDDYNEQARIRQKNDADEKAALAKKKEIQKKNEDDEKTAKEKQKQLRADYNKNIAEGRQQDVKDIEEYGSQLQAADDAEIKRLADNEKKRLEAKAKLAELNVLNNPDSPDAKINKIKADLELELSALAEGDIQKQILTKKAEDAINQIKKEAREADKKQHEYTEEEKLAITANTLGQLSEVIGKESATGKALAVGQAVINTYLGATKALSQGGIFGFVAAAGVIAAGLANVQKIISVKLPGKAGSTGGATPSISQAAPLTPQVSGTRLLSEQINQSGNAAAPKPIQAYVIEGQGADAQQRISRLSRAARLGG